jgi:MFS family permease
MSDSKVVSATPVARPSPRRLSRAAGFAAAVAFLLLFQAAASAATPLFVVYQHEWGFSAATITLIFAVFVFGLLCALLVAGGLSDYVGRRPLLVAGLALEAVAMLLFLLANGVGMLMAARLVQGVASGLALPTIAATLVDFNPPYAPSRAATVNGAGPIAGLAIGSIVCGALVQYGPAPTHLVWALLLSLAVIAIALVLALPESALPQSGAIRSLRPRLRVPSSLRGDIYALAPIIMASWALGGLYLSLGPSATRTVFSISNHFIGGLVATLLCGTGAVAAYLLRRSPGTVLVLRLSVTLLAIGTALTLIGILPHIIAYAVAGTVIAGVGYGASGLASFGMVGKLASPIKADERGELFAVVYTIAYLSFSLPALVAGYIATQVGLYRTVVGYAIAVIIIAVAAFLVQEARLARRSSPTVR